jgi:hypothetical protein
VDADVFELELGPVVGGVVEGWVAGREDGGLGDWFYGHGCGLLVEDADGGV